MVFTLSFHRMFWLAMMSFLGLLQAVMPPPGLAQDVPIVSPDGYFFRDGDDALWARPDFDHADWQYQASRRIDVPEGIRWVRARIHIPEDYYGARQPLSVIVGAMASSELYWNGQLIGRNGVPGARAVDEIPGRITARYHLPPDVARAGDNLLAIRLSSQQLQALRKDIDLEIVVSPYLDISHVRLVRHVPALVLFGAIAASIVLFGAMYFLHRRDRASLWMALTFLLLAGQFGAEVYKGLVNYSYPVQLYRYAALALFAYGAVASLLMAILWRLHVPARERYISLALAHVLAIALAAQVTLMEPRLMMLILAFVAMCLILALRGMLRRQKGSLPLALGLATICAAALEGTTLFLDRGFFYGMAVLAAILFVLQARDFRRTEQAADKAAAQSARMELELVKRHIQPHFMMNTLGALTEWILENPRASVDMIQALAEEFRLLNEVSSKEKIPLSQEIELCNAHLKIMSYRQDQTLLLETQIDDTSAEVPPAIFHTLVENALTHNQYDDDTVIFLLRQRVQDGFVYDFTAPRGVQGAVPSRSAGHGLGTAYMEARLEEAWPGAFRLEAGPNEDGDWHTQIIIGATKNV